MSTGKELARQSDDPVHKALTAYKPGEYNILTPIISIDRLPEMSRLSVRVVQADPDVDGGDCYHSKLFMKANERAPSKVLLDKIAAAAGISWLESRRLDDRTDPYLCEWSATGELVDFDGTKRRFARSKTIDLRDESPNAKAMTAGMLKQQRGMITELAESKACNRVIRAALSMKQKYTVDELKRPFVIPRLVPDMDMADPQVKAAVVAHRLGAEHKLFGPAPGAPTVIDGSTGEVLEPEVLAADDDEPFPQPPDAEPEPDPDKIGCACFCECSSDLTDEPAIVAYTRKKYKKVLCSKCAPASQTYEAKRHEESAGAA